MTPLEFLRSLRGGRRAVYAPARRAGLGVATQALADEVAAAGRKLVEDPSPARWWIPDQDDPDRRVISSSGALRLGIDGDEVVAVADDGRVVTPADVIIAPVTSPIPRDMAQRLHDAVCEICGVPHRRWYLVSETEPDSDQADGDAALPPPDPPGMPAAVPALEMARRIAQRHRDATCQICMTRYSRCYCKEDARA